MKPPAAIRDAIRGTCFDVDHRIVGLSEADAAAWSRANAVRHAETLRAILGHAERTGRTEMDILNASGLSCGHQDFSIVGYLRGETALKVRWTALESPNSPYLPNEVFEGYVERLGIRVERVDFATPHGFGGEGDGPYDVVLFTEIAEHLDHTAFLGALAAIRERMRADGTIVVTTPNLVSLPNRLRILFGNGDGPYFGDGRLNRERGLYGHIAIYDARRLARLLRDAGFRVSEVRTFNSYFRPAFRRDPAAWIGTILVEAASRLAPSGGGTLFVSAAKGEPVPVPFAI